MKMEKIEFMVYGPAGIEKLIAESAEDGVRHCYHDPHGTERPLRECSTAYKVTVIVEKGHESNIFDGDDMKWESSGGTITAKAIFTPHGVIDLRPEDENSK